MHMKIKINYTYYNLYLLDILISLAADNQANEDSKYGSKVIIALDQLPKQRLKRNVVRSRMDLIGKYEILI